jgi:energy-coupling factor transport system permease protein
MELVYQFRSGNSFLHHLDPVTKTVALFAISFLAFGSFFSIPQVCLALATIFIAMVLGHISVKDLWRGTGLMFLASISFFVIQTLLLKVHGHNIVFFAFSKPIYLETIDYSLAVSLRIYSIFLVSFIFIRTTHPRDLAVSFVQILNLPYRIPYAFFIALRIMPLIEDEAKTITAAHRVRGVGEKQGLRGRIENAKRFTVPLLIRSLRSASVTVQSMESRGFGAFPQRTYVDEIKMTRTGKVITFSLIAIVIIWYLLIFLGVVQLNYSMQ